MNLHDLIFKATGTLAELERAKRQLGSLTVNLSGCDQTCDNPEWLEPEGSLPKLEQLLHRTLVTTEVILAHAETLRVLLEENDVKLAS